MKVTLTKDFAAWCSNDENLIASDLKQYNILVDIDSRFRKRLLNQGLGKRQILELMGSIRPIGYSGYGLFSQLRYILWNWPNGDRILYPVNSIGEIYIGTDDAIWSQYWPFLAQSEDGGLICNLNVYPSALTDDCTDHDGVWLGGQSHFGHFIVNFLAPLLKNSGAIEQIRKTGRIYAPSGYSALHRELIERLTGVEGIDFHETSGPNGIYTLRRVIVPALTDAMDAVAKLQGRLEQTGSDRAILNGKRVYICRNKSGDSDRLVIGKYFAQQLIDLGFTLCDPLRLSISERLAIIGDAEWILTESGSCSLNAYLFGNRDSVIRSLIPRCVFQSPISTELNMLLPVLAQVSKGNYIPLESNMASSINNFYNICNPPSAVSVLDSFQNESWSERCL